jgi:DNA-binding beta-propeller fold protein YncE
MKPFNRVLLGLLAALPAAWGGAAQAKDLFYHLGNGMVQVIDGDTDTISATIRMKGWTREAALSSDRKFLYVQASRHLIHKVSLPDHKLVGTADVNQGGWERLIFGFTMAPDDRSVYAAMFSRRIDGGEVAIGAPVVAQVDVSSGKILRSVEVPWGVARLILVKGGSTIYAFGKDLYKIDASGPELKVTETVPMFDKKWNILPLWEYGWESNGVSLVNYYTPELMGVLAVDAKTGELTDLPIKGDPVLAYSVIGTPDGKTAYALMDDLTEIDLAGKKYGRVVPLAEGTSYGLGLSSDGKKIYAGAGGSTVTVFDAKTLKPRKLIQMGSDGMDLRRITY